MAFKSGLFNSVNGDRRYKADFFAEYFASFIANGVFPNPSTGLQVIAGTGMTVNIKVGKAWIKGYYFANDADYTLQLDVADGVLKRIDRIGLRLDFLSREIVPVIIKGTFSSNPVAPALQRDADAYELALADVFINNGVISISQGNITDQRLNTALCGIVHGTVDQVDTSTIFNQYQSWFGDFTVEKQADFDAWIASLQDLLSGDVAGNLAARITTLEGDIARHTADYLHHTGYATATGSANVYIATLTPALSAYAEGVSLRLKINVTNTGASMVNVNGLGEKSIKKANGADVNIGQLKVGSIYTLSYNGSAFILQGEGGDLSDADKTNLINSINNIYRS